MWDFAAPVLAVKEAGGVALAADGGAIDWRTCQWGHCWLPVRPLPPRYCRYAEFSKGRGAPALRWAKRIV